MKNLKNKVLFSCFLWGALLFASMATVLMAQVPPRPEPARLVNDYAGIFTAQEKMSMERSLVDFFDSTSNQITVVTVSDLGGYDVAEFAYMIGDQWGVGSKKYNNGIVLLIKPKTASENGRTFIAPGYGLEGAIPDAICKRIIEEEMIPSFKTNNYYGGTIKALDVLKKLSSGEITSKEYVSSANGVSAIVGGIIIFVILISIMCVMGSKSKNDGFNGNNKNKGGGIDPMLAIWLLGSATNRQHSGSWGGFSGGGGGGFGGFGGGGFGGGGAGGSW